MQRLKIIFVLTILATIGNCSKYNLIYGQTSKPVDWCGTETNNTWTQTVTPDSLVGNWRIGKITYNKGTAQTHNFDTTYNVNAQLILNSNGTGKIYSTPLNWTLKTSPNSSPTLSITKLDTLFPFQVSFIYNGPTETRIEGTPKTHPQSTFIVIARHIAVTGEWEQAYISFERE